MRKILRFLLALVGLVLIFDSMPRVIRYLSDQNASTALNAIVRESVVTVREVPEPLPREPGAQPPPREQAPICVDFAALQQQNPDVIGWLYSPDTPIDLPVVQGENNSHYLYRLLDGSTNANGSLFADYRNASDFSDRNTIIYGHNMKNGKMFGTLNSYKDQSYFDEHPVIWLLTPQGDYKVELFAGYVTGPASEIYTLALSDREAAELARQGREQSTFVSPVEFTAGDRILALSTCTYEFDNARYVLLGRIKKVLPT